MNKTNSSILDNIGISLTLVGVPLGMYLTQIFPVVKWSIVFMFLSILLIVSFKNLFFGKLPLFNNGFKLVLLFQCLMLFYGLLSSGKMTGQYLSFHLYIITLILAFSSKKRNIRFENLIETVFYVSAITSIFGFYYLQSGLVTSSENYFDRQSDTYVLDAFTIALGALVNFISALFLLFKKSKFKLFFLIFFCIDVFIIFMSTKRTPVFTSFIILILFFYKKGVIDKKKVLKYLKLFFLVVFCLLFIYLSNDSIKLVIDDFIYNFYNGVLNILGNTDVKDTSGSALYRYKTRLFAYNYIDNNFNFFNYIFGAGYMTKWLDNPILQSYFDMGVVGFLLFVYLIVILPLKSFFKLNNELTLFAMLFCLYNTLSSYSSGNPYLYIKFIPVVFLVFTIHLENLKNENNNNISLHSPL